MMLPLEERVDPGKWKAVTLTVLMHVLLVGVLFLGVRWHNRPPEAVSVEVWRDVPAQAAPPPVAPAPPPPPEPEPVRKAPPVPPPVAPKAEPKPTPKPDIAVKAEKPKPEPKPVPKAESKPEPKPQPKAAEPKRPEPARPNFDAALKREMEQIERDKALREKQQRAEQETRLLAQAAADKAAEQAAAAKRRGLEQYEGKIQRKIRGNLSHPELKGNPVAQLIVIQLPSGEVIDVQIKKPSGVPSYDEAIIRAIRKSSPLPKPDDPALFARELTLTFCPDEERGCR